MEAEIQSPNGVCVVMDPKLGSIYLEEETPFLPLGLTAHEAGNSEAASVQERYIFLRS